MRIRSSFWLSAQSACEELPKISIAMNKKMTSTLPKDFLLAIRFFYPCLCARSSNGRTLVSSFFAHPALVATNFGQNSLTEVQLSSKENIAERGKPWCRVERTRVIENFMRFSLKAKNSHPIGILVFSLASCCLFVGGAFALDEAKIHVAGTPNITSFVYHVGKEKGFYREEGIELQPIMAGMLQGIQGLIGGSFDYSQMLGQGGSAIMRGAPLKIVMAFDTPFMVPAWNKKYEKHPGPERQTTGGFQFWRCAGPDDPRAAASLRPGADARCDPARH